MSESRDVDAPVVESAERAVTLAESATEEHKQSFDGSTRAKVQLVKELVAMANANGGSVVYGVDDSGHVVGVDAETARRLDPSKLGDYLSSYVGDQRVELDIGPETLNEARVIRIRVAPSASPPIIMEVDGTCPTGARQETLFRAGTALVRDHTSARPARRADFVRWIAAAEKRGERAAYDLMRMVAERPPGTVVQFAVPETPSARLSDATRAYTLDRRKLLGSDELLALAADTDQLDLSDEASHELLIQSALRKRTTLWWWAAELRPSAGWLADQLRRAARASDRDVSDAGQPILELAAALCPVVFDELRSALAGSEKYSHFREAAAACTDSESTLARLRLRPGAAAADSTREDCVALLRTAATATDNRGAAARRVTRPVLAFALSSLLT